MNIHVSIENIALKLVLIYTCIRKSCDDQILIKKKRISCEPVLVVMCLYAKPSNRFVIYLHRN